MLGLYYVVQLQGTMKPVSLEAGSGAEPQCLHRIESNCADDEPRSFETGVWGRAPVLGLYSNALSISRNDLDKVFTEADKEASTSREAPP